MKEEQIELIEKYLQGHMEEAERAAFEQRLAQEPALAEELIFLRDLQESLQLKSKVDNLRVMSDKVGAKHFQATPDTKIVALKKQRKINFRYWAAAAILLLVAISTIIWFRLEATYEIHALRSENTEIANTNLRGNESPNSISILKEISIDDPEYLKAQFTLGQYYLNNNQLAAARAAFSSILFNQKNPNYRLNQVNLELCQWLFILSQLEKGNEEAVSDQLSGLIDSNISQKYKSLAENLLKKLNHPAYQWFN